MVGVERAVGGEGGMRWPVRHFTEDVAYYDAGPRDNYLGEPLNPTPLVDGMLHLLHPGHPGITKRHTYVCSGGGWASYRSCGYVCPPGQAHADHPSKCPNCGNPMGVGWTDLQVPPHAFSACWRE